MDSVDIPACPGSGKTTLLVAKLAILARKWKYRTRGICVLSHTNVARHEIENRLGNTSVGRSLLGYPHYIGTIHGFVNEFLAIPWLRAKGYPIHVIDTDICLRHRWNILPYRTRIALNKVGHDEQSLQVKAGDFSVGDLAWGRNKTLCRETPTYQEIQRVCAQSANDGYFCFDELLMWAGDLLEKMPYVNDVLRNRFPMLFIDEAQDNSEVQAAILYRLFMDGMGVPIRQRFGDDNQAIYTSMNGVEATTDRFPRADLQIFKLPTSHRFGQDIADLANPLGVIPHGLIGQGPRKPFARAPKSPLHTVFLFDENCQDQVLGAYGELLVETFTDDELRNGVFCAVGQIHRDTGAGNEPRHIGHYWSAYDPLLAASDPKPPTFVQYAITSQSTAISRGEAYPGIEKLAEGILRLARMANNGNRGVRRLSTHRQIQDALEHIPEWRCHYDDLIVEFIISLQPLTQKTWSARWSKVVHGIAQAIAGANLAGQPVDAFLEWPRDTDGNESTNIRSSTPDNVYRYPRDVPKVEIRVGSIHSVKGQTHTATLVLETFWNDHNLKCLTPWLLREPKKPKAQVRNTKRLKLHYVAMTRPTHLLCLGMKKSTFENQPEFLEKLRTCGWNIKIVE
jgi:hypothetical protein